MSVSTTLTLPAQPTTAGTVSVIPLGGDGFSAPHSAYSLRSQRLDHDASGGTAAITCVLDARYVSLVSFVNLFIDQASASDEIVRIELEGAGTPIIRDNFTLTANPTTVDAGNIWYPPTWVLPGADRVCLIRFTADNVDGNDSFMSALIYNFDIRVREVTNVGFLGWARGPVSS